MYSRLLACSLALALSSSLLKAQEVQVPPGSIEITGMTLNILDTPNFNYSGTQKRTPPSKKWIEIETSFTSKVPLVPELTFNYFVAMDAKRTQSVFTGSVSHVRITEGVGKFVSIYISPDTITAIMGPRGTATPELIDQATVQVLYQGAPMAEASLNKAPATGWWTGMRQLSGYLLSKNETPFAPLWWDRYEAIKSANR